MKTYFRLYADANKADFKSSIFDLISGDKETKQTKGLAYIFYHYNDFLFEFLKSEKVKKAISETLEPLEKKMVFSKITSIEVNAEKFATNNKKADIVIRINSEKELPLAIIIEAKSIKVNTNDKKASTQIQNYLHEIPELNGHKTIGIILTKYGQIIPNITNTKIINISWSNIIQMLTDFCKKTNKKKTLINIKKLLFNT